MTKYPAGIVNGVEKFKLGVTAQKGGVATVIIILSLLLQAKVEPHISQKILEQFPENTVAVSIAGVLAALWNAGKYWAKRLARFINTKGGRP